LVVCCSTVAEKPLVRQDGVEQTVPEGYADSCVHSGEKPVPELAVLTGSVLCRAFCVVAGVQEFGGCVAFARSRGTANAVGGCGEFGGDGLSLPDKGCEVGGVGFAQRGEGVIAGADGEADAAIGLHPPGVREQRPAGPGPRATRNGATPSAARVEAVASSSVSSRV
jgi:hypothetical protein